MIRLLVCRSNSDSKSNILCGSRHWRNDGKGLIDWPLCARADCRIKIPRPIIDIISSWTKSQTASVVKLCSPMRGRHTKHVCYEYAMDFALLEQFGEIDPMIIVIEVGGMIIWMRP